MFAGPVFFREAATLPRRPRFYAARSAYVLSLIIVIATAWLVLAGTQVIRSVGDTARFGAIAFQIIAPLQLALVLFFAALTTASAVAQEKDRRTLVLLMMTRLNHCELVLGRLLGSLLQVASLLLAGIPVFIMLTLFGGISYAQVAQVLLVSAAAALAAGSIGSTIALWREKTFQTLAMTTLAIVVWIVLGEVFWAAPFGPTVLGINSQMIGNAISPFRAILVATSAEMASSQGSSNPINAGVQGFLGVSLLMSLLLNLLAIVRIRAWNSISEHRTTTIAEQQSTETQASPGQARESIWGAEHDLSQADHSQADLARAGHVDARRKVSAGKSRRVWNNPVLWREICTWAHGRKIVALRLGYLAIFAVAALVLHASIASGAATQRHQQRSVLPVATQSLAPLLVVSLALVNALAVTSITAERDGGALDMLLVTDLSPKEFVFGKLGGVFWVTKEMVVLPMGLAIYLWFAGGVTLENLIFLLIGAAVLYLFAATVGIHCGMIYASSRSAIGVSLGITFFLLLGIVTCMRLMISLSGSFHVQLAPFAAMILGGGVGLFVTLGARNPSGAIGLASLILPLATFHAITSFFLHQSLGVFLVTTGAYGFGTLALLIPAISEFDLAMGRTTGED